MQHSKKVTRLGIDLGKNTFHLFGVDEAERQSIKKKLSRSKFLAYFVNLPPCLIGMEACSSSHHWARELTKLGHEVKLISPQFVRPYVKGNKNDYNDAEAICEAISRPNMRFVTVKSIEQQDIQSLHRVRESAKKQRTAVANQIRGLLAERGIVLATGINQLRTKLMTVLDESSDRITDLLRSMVMDLFSELRRSDARVKRYDREINRVHASNEVCQRLGQIPGIGPLTATAIISSVGDGKQFKNGRQLAASLGLVPKQHTTGDRPVLLGISKRGDNYIRSLLVQGARSVIYALDGKTDKRSQWLRALIARQGSNKAAVALANKNARVIWALMNKGGSYTSNPL